MTRRRLAAALCLALALGACATAPPQKATRNASCLPAGRLLVVARVPNEENRAVYESAAHQLVLTLRATSDAVGTPDWINEAAQDGQGVWAATIVYRLQRGGRLTPEEARILFERYGITTLVMADLTEYDQIWGKYGKFTRATLDGSAVDLVADTPLWRIRGHAEVDEMRGRAFGYAMEQAVQQLADGICPQKKPFSITETWRYFRR